MVVWQCLTPAHPSRVRGNNLSRWLLVQSLVYKLVQLLLAGVMYLFARRCCVAKVGKSTRAYTNKPAIVHSGQLSRLHFAWNFEMLLSFMYVTAVGSQTQLLNGKEIYVQESLEN